MKFADGSEVMLGVCSATCVDQIDGFLTNGKTYMVEGLRVEEGRIVVTDDRGLEGWFKSERFVSDIGRKY